jgi:hypothetical protein
MVDMLCGGGGKEGPEQAGSGRKILSRVIGHTVVTVEERNERGANG